MIKRFGSIFLAIASMVFLAACSFHGNTVRVSTVESLRVEKADADGTLRIIVTGEVPNAGWTDIRLRRLKDKTATKDVLTYDLIGRSPRRTKGHSMAGPMKPEKVRATLIITKYYPGARLVQVSGGNNDVAEPIPGSTSLRGTGSLRKTKSR
jgi:hypothetical protein